MRGFTFSIILVLSTMAHENGLAQTDKDPLFGYVLTYNGSGQVSGTALLIEYVSNANQFRFWRYVQLTPQYDSHVTNFVGRQYHHMHNQGNFPFLAAVFNPTTFTYTSSPVTLTSAMVTQCHLYDKPYHVALGDASCLVNCHGLAMWKGHWIEPDQLYGGAGIVINDEYESGVAPQAAFFFKRTTGMTPSYFHSYVVTFKSLVFGGYTFYVTDYVMEKFNTGPALQGPTTAETTGTTVQRKRK